MPRPRPRRFSAPAQRALVAAILTLALLFVALPVALWPVTEILNSRQAEVRIGELGTLLKVKVADTPLRRSYGLQGRGSLGEDEGMLFEFDRPEHPTFSRKAVPFDLEVLFVSAQGHVVGIRPLDGAHPTASSPRAVVRALEVAAGWSERHGVSLGATLTVEGR